MTDIETGLFLGKIPYAKIGTGPDPIVVFNGGNAFLRRTDKARTRRYAKLIGKLLPPGRCFYILDYDMAPPAGYGLDMIVRDFAQIMRTEIGAASVMGISFGGFVATRFAADHPDLVNSLILLVSAHRMSPEGRHRIARQIDFVRHGDFYAMLMESAAIFRRPWFNLLLKLRIRLERKRLHQKMAGRDTIIRSLGIILGEDFARNHEWLARISTRTLVIGGTRDQFFDRAAYDETAGMIPQARLALFEGETHMLPAERSGDVAREIAAFLA